ncbi:MAG TPA: type II toxin-antitoxin system VapC family toxin [Terracidiphilus sp.]|nr:type II toxin-antitoxin system VapC family toxin [Terracidiphilus sp.]
MDLLLDTHAFLWWDSHDPNLPSAFQAAIESPKNNIHVSAATVWEIAIKRATGKLVFSGSTAKSIARHGFSPLPITVEHAEWAGSLPSLHRDPFDRLLVAQAQLENLILVTIDQQILRYQVPHL